MGRQDNKNRTNNLKQSFQTGEGGGVKENRCVGKRKEPYAVLVWEEVAPEWHLRWRAGQMAGVGVRDK